MSASWTQIKFVRGTLLIGMHIVSYIELCGSNCLKTAN